MRLRKPGGGVGVAEGEADGGISEGAIANVRHAGGGVVLVEWESVGGVEATEGGLIVEFFECAGEDGLVAIGVDISCVAGVIKGGPKKVTASGGEVDDGGFGSGAVEGAVSSAIDLQAVERGRGDGAEVEVPADVGGGDAVDEDLVGFGAAATNIK